MDSILQLGMPLLDILNQHGYPAYLVGGAVRDSLMGCNIHDLDITTAALPHEILSVFSHLRCIKTGEKHGTITVLTEHGPVEITTFRTESTYSDHRRPDSVMFTTKLEQDLARRDFTINAMALGRDGLIDLFGGQTDLSNKQLRCVGDPNQRFQEDALRMLRGMRFSSCLNFQLETATAAAIHRHHHQLSHISPERITAELLRLLTGDSPKQVLLEYADVISTLIPDLAPTIGFCQHSPYHDFDVYTHSVNTVEHIPPTPILRLAALLHDIAKPVTLQLDSKHIGHFPFHAKLGGELVAQRLETLRLDNATRLGVAKLISHHGLTRDLNPKDVARCLSKLGESLFFQLLHLDRADSISKKVSTTCRDAHWDKIESTARSLIESNTCLWRHQLAVNGSDVLSSGLTGQEIGISLDILLQHVVHGTLKNDRDALLAWLHNYALSITPNPKSP